MVKVILNPYGLAYAMGLMAHGTPRANPEPLTLDDYINLAEQIGAKGAELYTPLLDELNADSLARLRQRFDAMEFSAVMSQPLTTPVNRSITCAKALGASVIRMHLTPVLCGDRAEPACNWQETVAGVKKMLKVSAALAAEYNLSLAIENHQDFTSLELMELCETTAPNVGICLDTGNALSVGEDPVEFARTIAPRLKHLHMKDYRAHWSDEGYRLVRCPVGDGAIPFEQIMSVLDRGAGLVAALEIGALSARHIRLLTASWWNGYAPRSATSLAAGLLAARVRRIPESEDWRTPWELGAAPHEIVQYELDQVHRSAANLRKMGLL